MSRACITIDVVYCHVCKTDYPHARPSSGGFVCFKCGTLKHPGMIARFHKCVHKECGAWYADGSNHLEVCPVEREIRRKKAGK